MMRIKTNHKPRPLFYGSELAPKIAEALRAEYDWYSAEQFNEALFFQYRGEWYDLGEFTRGGPAGWDGCRPDSAFGGLLVRILDQNDGYGVIVANCWS